MTGNLDYLKELVVLGPVIIYRLERGVMEDVWFQVERRGDQSLPTELKMGTMKNILPMNYVSELSDFITALISIPVTKSTVQHLDFSRTESESSINVTCASFQKNEYDFNHFLHEANILF